MRDKRKGKKTTLRIGTFIAITFLMVYIPSLINWIYGKGINTALIQNGVIEDALNVTGVLVRDETVIKAPQKGKCILDINEGEKVGRNQRIAMILNDAYQKQLDELNKMDQNILQVQKEKSATQEIFSDDAKKIDAEIAQKLQLMVGEDYANSLGRTGKITEDINALIKKKATITGSLSTPDTYLNSLKQQRDKLQQDLNASTKEVVSENSGIVSYTVDGYESILRPDAIKQLTPKSIEDVKAVQVKNDSNSIDVDTDKPFAKVIKDVEYRIVVPINAQKASLFKVGGTLDIRINDVNKTMDAEVEYISQETDGKCLISLKVDKASSETAALRKVNVDLILNNYEGLKIPISSLRDISPDGKTASLVVVRAHYAYISKVRIDGRNEESAIVSNIDGETKNKIRLYDTYVINPQNIQEGQEIK